MRKVLTLLIAVMFLTTAMLGCTVGKEPAKSSVVEASGESTAKEQLRIMWVNPLLGSTAYAPLDEGCKKAAEDYNLELQIAGPATIDAEAMIQAIETGIADKVDGIITVAFAEAAFLPVLQKAKEAGIPVVLVNSDIADESLRLAWLGTDEVAYGVQAAELFAEKTGQKANIAIMMSTLDIPNQVKQADSFESSIGKWPNMKVIIREADNADMAKSMTKIDELVTAYPEIDSILYLESVGVAAAAQVAAERSKELTILGVDCNPETEDGIKNGTIWGTLVQNYYRQGYEGVRIIADYYAGVKTPSKTDAGCVFVDKSNIDSYMEDVMATVHYKGTPY